MLSLHGRNGENHKIKDGQMINGCWWRKERAMTRKQKKKTDDHCDNDEDTM